ncbi:MAG: ATP-binding protein [Gammaproteobacteria bacterium]|nr:ATP-binding protein [Gammaproteobacteria bacterium]
MGDDDLMDVAATWSFWDRPPPPSIRRAVKLPRSLSDRTALVIQGVRRCGKSTLLAQLIRRYRLKRRDCLFVNFEDPRLAGSLSHETLERLTRVFGELRGEAETLTIFLDEVQWVNGWERWLRSKLDRPGRYRFVVSGSNAHLLSGELSSVLTGRHITVELFPFDFPEFRSMHPDGTVAEYLRRGGFPEPGRLSDLPLQREDRQDGRWAWAGVKHGARQGDGFHGTNASDSADLLLRQYFIDILQRDVRERVGARSSLALRQIVQMVFESAGSELSLRRIAAASGVAVETVSAYLEACEQAYLLFQCPWFAFSERKRSQRNRKYYPVDTALRRVAVTRTGADAGKALECATFIELKKRYRDVFYWRGAGEVDFVISTGERPTPVQVTVEGAGERHLRALDDFYETFPHATEAVIVTMGEFPAILSSLDPDD